MLVSAWWCTVIVWWYFAQWHQKYNVDPSFHRDIQVSYLGEAAEAQCILPACRGAVFMQECWVGRYTAVHQWTVTLAQRHLGANVAQNVRCAAELTLKGTKTWTHTHQSKNKYITVLLSPCYERSCGGTKLTVQWHIKGNVIRYN